MKDETIYHIYAKNVCLYPCLREEEFKIKWAELKGMVGLMKTDYIEEDLSFVECPADNVGGAGGSFEDNLDRHINRTLNLFVDILHISVYNEVKDF